VRRREASASGALRLRPMSAHVEVWAASRPTAAGSHFERHVESGNAKRGRAPCGSPTCRIVAVSRTGSLSRGRGMRRSGEHPPGSVRYQAAIGRPGGKPTGDDGVSQQLPPPPRAALETRRARPVPSGLVQSRFGRSDCRRHRQHEDHRGGREARPTLHPEGLRVLLPLSSRAWSFR
jgi:hypothetical protein